MKTSTLSMRRQLFAEQNGRCFFCYCPMLMNVRPGHPQKCTRDHLTPRGRGGSTDKENVRAACSSCNDLKLDMTLAEFRAAYPTPAAIERGKEEARAKRDGRIKRRRQFNAEMRERQIAQAAKEAE